LASAAKDKSRKTDSSVFKLQLDTYVDGNQKSVPKTTWDVETKKKLSSQKPGTRKPSTLKWMDGNDDFHPFPISNELIHHPIETTTRT